MTEAQDGRESPEHPGGQPRRRGDHSSRRCWRLGSVQLAEHAAPGAATLQVLQGRVRLVTSVESSEWDQGDHVAIPPARHRLGELGGTLPSLTVAATPSG
jgi:hypothetical protein